MKFSAVNVTAFDIYVLTLPKKFLENRLKITKKYIYINIVICVFVVLSNCCRIRKAGVENQFGCVSERVCACCLSLSRVQVTHMLGICCGLIYRCSEVVMSSCTTNNCQGDLQLMWTGEDPKHEMSACPGM